MVKVIFLENIEDNKVGDVKEVADGYARNFLFRKEIAKLATDEEVKNLEGKIAKLKKEEEGKVKEAEKLGEKLAKKKIVLTEEVNEEGHLYGSVGNKEIAAKMEEAGFEIESGQIEIEEPIKTLGDHEILVKVGHGVEQKITITVERAA
jgi:large subunit ribosomal protein L9